MTVAELYTAGGRHQPHAKGWTYCGTGVICLVKDHGRRSYFFSFYCPVNAILLWEQEVYNGIAYSSPTPFLHTFEAEVTNCLHYFLLLSFFTGVQWLTPYINLHTTFCFFLLVN
ncbi:hypothetical protein AAG570_011931 [Ranatra chinensis]|uniref:WH1 domain-containing protein n=1 Tax=Ranatra chinensis TaxID=642074 RepID=A0ABD0YHJ3_9HEMI